MFFSTKETPFYKINFSTIKFEVLFFLTR